ncbi:MAG TPA: M48 family metalloprotease [Allosphingosinicella sp.]|jgi:Zn-dependent protease with chaperone function
MAVHGYITHAARAKRFTAWLIALYLAVFQLLGAFALTVFLLLFDYENTPFINPAGYAVRYALPLALLSALLFWRLYRNHAKFVARGLGIRIVERAEEPRFVAIAEEQCTAQGVRVPRFGVLEADEPNALTVGEGPARGLIAVTRGLLERLDDDELAALLAHEAAHIRLGDTKILAANHALMRTAIMFQTHNPLRIEDWRQMVIPLIIPPFLLLMLAGGAATTVSMQLARFARRGLKLGRDHIADGEAVRATHHPEALIDALRKVGGRGAFDGSYAVEGLLFDAPTDRDGGRRAPIAARIATIAALGGAMIDPGRKRRDTRVRRAAPRAVFGRAAVIAAPNEFERDRSGKPLEEPARPSLAMLLSWFTDRQAFWRWQYACIAWAEWRIDDKRNALGLKPAMVIPAAAVTMFLAVFHWPADGDLRKLRSTFDPSSLVVLGKLMEQKTFCSGPSYPDGTCDRRGGAAATPKPAPASQVSASAAAAGGTAARKPNGPPDFGQTMLPFVLIFGLLLCANRPDLVRKLFNRRS